MSNNGDIDMKSLMEAWQRNYDVDWWPRQNGEDSRKDIGDIDRAPCPSLAELQLHKTRSRNKGIR